MYRACSSKQLSKKCVCAVCTSVSECACISLTHLISIHAWASFILLSQWCVINIYIFLYVWLMEENKFTCFLASTIRILALLYVLSTVLRISSSNLLFFFICVINSGFLTSFKSNNCFLFCTC